MFGMQDLGVVSAYLLAFAGMIVCVIYGITHWNRDDEPAKPEDIHWAQEEKEQVEKTL